MLIVFTKYSDDTYGSYDQGEALSLWYHDTAKRNGMSAGGPGSDGCKPFSLRMLADSKSVPRWSEQAFIPEQGSYDRIRYLKKGRLPVAVGIHPYDEPDDLTLLDGLIAHVLPARVAAGRCAVVITRKDTQVEYEA